MKKKIFICLFILIILLSTGCIKKKESTKKNNDIEQKVKDNQLIINGYDLTLSEPGTFDKLSFKYPDKTTINSLTTSMTLVYYKKASDQTLFRIGFGKMYGTNIEDVMKGFIKTGEKNYNGVTWSIYTRDGYNSYAMNYGYDIYAIGFIYNDSSLSQFEEEFMKTVTISKELIS